MGLDLMALADPFGYPYPVSTNDAGFDQFFYGAEDVFQSMFNDYVSTDHLDLEEATGQMYSALSTDFESWSSSDDTPAIAAGIITPPGQQTTGLHTPTTCEPFGRASTINAAIVSSESSSPSKCPPNRGAQIVVGGVNDDLWGRYSPPSPDQSHPPLRADQTTKVTERNGPSLEATTTTSPSPSTTTPATRAPSKSRSFKKTPPTKGRVSKPKSSKSTPRSCKSQIRKQVLSSVLKMSLSQQDSIGPQSLQWKGQYGTEMGNTYAITSGAEQLLSPPPSAKSSIGDATMGFQRHPDRLSMPTESTSGGDALNGHNNNHDNGNNNGNLDGNSSSMYLYPNGFSPTDTFTGALAFPPQPGEATDHFMEYAAGQAYYSPNSAEQDILSNRTLNPALVTPNTLQHGGQPTFAVADPGLGYETYPNIMGPSSDGAGQPTSWLNPNYNGSTVNQPQHSIAPHIYPTDNRHQPVLEASRQLAEITSGHNGLAHDAYLGDKTGVYMVEGPGTNTGPSPLPMAANIATMAHASAILPLAPLGSPLQRQIPSRFELSQGSLIANRSPINRGSIAARRNQSNHRRNYSQPQPLAGVPYSALGRTSSSMPVTPTCQTSFAFDQTCFVNSTPNDKHKILTGVAPSGSSKTKARREKEARERKKLEQDALRAKSRRVSLVMQNIIDKTGAEPIDLERLLELD